MPDLEPAEALSVPVHTRRDPKAAEFYLRMVFSTLVDADFLDTEAHFNADRAGLRGATTTIDELWHRFTRNHDASFGEAEGIVNGVRKEIYEACLAAARLPPGLFRLTVRIPTSERHKS